MIRNRNIARDAEIAIHKIAGGGGYPLKTGGVTMYVDGDNGNDNNDGLSPDNAKATIQQAVTDAGAFSRIYVFPKNMAAGATDPASYEQNVIIPATHECLQIIGVPYGGRTQGGLPQMKDGTGTSTAILIIRAPGCMIANIGINGAGNTGGGILLDDDASTKSAFGTTITNCHFKNCKGSTATNAATGGAIMWNTTGGAWQVLINHNKFYKCVGDIILLGTTSSRPQDVVIEDNIFSGPASSTDCNLYLAAGSGMDGVYVNRNVFTAMPAVGSGTNVRFADMTGCVGTLTNNTFACLVSEASTGELTFGASGTGAKIPTTVFMANNWGQSDSTAAAADGAAGEVFRT